MFLLFAICGEGMNCDTAILITKINIRMTRVSPASTGVKKSGLEPSTFAVPGLYSAYVELIH
jgi:hypothetical protein